MSNEIQDNKKIPSRRSLLLISLIVFVASSAFYSYLTTPEPVTIVTTETFETITVVKEPDIITKVVTVIEDTNKEN